jgi:hypothetical protein
MGQEDYVFGTSNFKVLNTYFLSPIIGQKGKPWPDPITYLHATDTTRRMGA